MIKKIIPIILCLSLIFGIGAYAANTDESGSDTAAVEQEMPAGDMQGGGGRGGMGGGGRGGAPADMQGGDGEMSTPPTDMQGGEMGTPPDDAQGADGETATPPDNGDMQGGGEMQGGMGGGMPDDAQNADMTETEESSSSMGILEFIETYQTPIIAVILLIAAFIFVIFYKRKRY